MSDETTTPSTPISSYQYLRKLDIDRSIFESFQHDLDLLLTEYHHKKQELAQLEQQLVLHLSSRLYGIERRQIEFEQDRLQTAQQNLLEDSA